MGIQTIPAADTGGETWVQIGTTQTPVTGTVVTFSSITPAKKIRIVSENVSLTAAGTLHITLNNDTSTSYFNARVTTGYGMTVVSASRIDGAAGTGTTFIQDLLIEYADQACPKTITGFNTSGGASAQVFPLQATYNETASITRIDFTTTSTFNAANTGTIAIYGAY